MYLIGCIFSYGLFISHSDEFKNMPWWKQAYTLIAWPLWLGIVIGLTIKTLLDKEE